MREASSSKPMPGGHAWRRVARTFALSIGAAFALLAFEWLFFITKQSSLSDYPVWVQVETLLVAAFPLMLVVTIASTALMAWAELWRTRWARWILEVLSLVPPAACITATVALMTENFSYSLFRFNVLTVPAPLRPVYAVAALIVCAFAIRWLSRRLRSPVLDRRGRTAVIAAAALLTLSIALMAQSIWRASHGREAWSLPDPARRPNILVIGGDGINADNMSAYGYARDTTPAIKAWSEEALVFGNAFANSFKTSGAVGALLTGRNPATTRVINHPATYRDEHAWKHFPGLLRRLGYRNGDFGVRYFSDAYAYNLREGFHVAIDGRSDYLEWLAYRLPIDPWVADSVRRFTFEVAERIFIRVAKAFGVLDEVNPFEIVNNPKNKTTDDARLMQLTVFLREAPEPFYAHAHFMVTHGGVFWPREQYVRFGHGKERSNYQPDWYDDAIRDFDARFQDVIDALKAAGRYEDTVIVLYSDHGIEHNSHLRVPLMIRWPGGAPRGTRSENAQLVDVPKTLLDFMDAEPPPWIEGDSLLEGAQDPLRGVFIVSANEEPSASFGALGTVTMTVCQRHYEMVIPTTEIRLHPVAGHTAPCPEDALPSEERAREQILAHLRERNWDLSGLER